MAYKTSYELHHHFPRLAEESGFMFNTHRPRVHIDWNKIRLIDIDNLIRERNFVLIEQHLNDILDCVFESEFDVRILDEGVLKMFRLAQLALEYQQFCRHYLDRSVYVLREEINSLAQELDSSKKQLHDKEEELKKIRKRSRHSFKTPLPYGNDNIAAMILKTLSNKSDNMFPSTSNADILQYNKCGYCYKVFLNQLYLQSHISRRHPETTEIPQKEQVVEKDKDNAKLNVEMMKLKSKLNDMEQAIVNNSNYHNNNKRDQETIVKDSKVLLVNDDKKNVRETRDAEVTTNNEEYFMNKFEDWKREEHEKYNKEINILRSQILDTINSIKDKQTVTEPKEDVLEKLYSTIKQQGAEILVLKQELKSSKFEKFNEDVEKSKETESQILYWSKRAEIQSKQYEALLLKLNDVANDAKASRDLVEAERERAAKLEILLQQHLNSKCSETAQTSTDDFVEAIKNQQLDHGSSQETNSFAEKKNNLKHTADHHTLETLHKKAQELLSRTSLSSSSESSNSATTNVPIRLLKVDSAIRVQLQNNKRPPQPRERRKTLVSDKNDSQIVHKTRKISKEKSTKNIFNTKVRKASSAVMSGSPMRVVRAKITEEVNSKLASCGVDPLNSRLTQNDFHKQRMEIQQLQEVKTKKNPSYEKVRNSLLAYLDSNTNLSNGMINGTHEFTSLSKVNKSLRSLTSVISNVKSKALALVKSSNGKNDNDKSRVVKADAAKKTMSLLHTPPGSVPHSPIDKHTSIKKNNIKNQDNGKSTRVPKSIYEHQTNLTRNRANTKTVHKKTLHAMDSDDESRESDHKYYKTTISETSKSIENLIKSPTRRPVSAERPLNQKVLNLAPQNEDLFKRPESAKILSNTKDSNSVKAEPFNNATSSEDVDSLTDTPIMKKVKSNENIQQVKQTKSVLKNASSNSSLNKKKVIFDMDAIQMKSVSASPSQSITEKSDDNKKFELGLVNLDGEEWDISSIENEPLKNDTTIQINTRTSPKIAELKQTIESQLARRNERPSTLIVGGVDILSGALAKAPSVAGSNTSLGSSILDDSDGVPVVSKKAFAKPRKLTDKDDSELDISEFSIDGIGNKNESF